MNKKSGFTLVELIIVIVIIGILSIIAVPIYRGHVRKSLATEAKALLAEVSASQEIYRARTGTWFIGVGNDVSTGVVTDIGVDARRNKYFNAFSMSFATSIANTMVIRTVGSDPKSDGMILSLTWSADSPQVINEDAGF